MEFGVEGMAEYGLDELPGDESRIGVDVLARVGIDFVEVGRLGRHFAESNQRLAP